MTDKLPPIYLPLLYGRLDTGSGDMECLEEENAEIETVRAYTRRADAVIDADGADVVKYIHAHSGCADCKIKPNPGENYPESCGECRWFYADLRVPND